MVRLNHVSPDMDVYCEVSRPNVASPVIAQKLDLRVKLGPLLWLAQ